MISFFRSMAGSMFVLLLIGTIGSAALAFHFAAYRVMSQMAHQRTVRTASIIEQVALALDEAPKGSRPQVFRFAQAVGVRAVTGPVPAGAAPDIQVSSLVQRDLIGKGVRIVGHVVHDCRAGTASCEVVSFVLHDGTRVTFSVDLPLITLHAELSDEAPFLTILFVACILALAYAAARFSTRPLSDLARAARRLEQDIGARPLPESGPSEVREAATAFNTMQRRIQRDVRERTYMLAAITHDLQTPLTRLRLRLEQIKDETLRAKLLEDLASMRDTVREGLDLARSLEGSESQQRIDVDALLDSMCSDAQDAGHDVVLSGGTGGAAVRGAPNALRRCITNLLDNATTYGSYARVESALNGSRVTVRIRDGGPGIPEEHMQSAFDPFYRLERSRSRETGGTGIGLTIARNIAERHHGTIALRNHPEGGLEVTLDLPLDGVA